MQLPKVMPFFAINIFLIQFIYFTNTLDLGFVRKLITSKLDTQ